MNRDNKLKFWVTLSNEWPDGDKVIGVEHSLDNCSADTIYVTECDNVGDAADQVVEYRDKAKEQWPDEEIYLSIFGDLAEFYGTNQEDISGKDDGKLHVEVCAMLHKTIGALFPKCPHCGEYAYKLTWYANEWSGEKYCSEGCANRVMEDEQKQEYIIETEELIKSITGIMEELFIYRAKYKDTCYCCGDISDAEDILQDVKNTLSKEVEDEN